MGDGGEGEAQLARQSDDGVEALVETGVVRRGRHDPEDGVLDHSLAQLGSDLVARRVGKVGVMVPLVEGVLVEAEEDVEGVLGRGDGGEGLGLGAVRELEGVLTLVGT